MGIFGKLFGKEEDQAASRGPLTVYAPVEGTVIPIREFPDELFSQEVLGPGCGILPSGEYVTAPFDGVVTHVIDTLHAVGLTGEGGVELLIHIGVDTVNMEGRGFRSFVGNGQKIRRGDKLIRFDREAIREAGYTDAVAVVVTNSDQFGEVELVKTGAAAAGDEVLKIARKE